MLRTRPRLLWLIEDMGMVLLCVFGQLFFTRHVNPSSRLLTWSKITEDAFIENTPVNKRITGEDWIIVETCPWRRGPWTSGGKRCRAGSDHGLQKF